MNQDLSVIYNVHHGEAFGVLIALYFYLTGLSAGSFVISTLAYGFGLERYRPLGRLGVIAATLTLSAAPLCLLLHVGRPLGAWRLFWNLNPASPLTWGSFLLAGYPIVCILYGWAIFGERERLARGLGLAGIPLALAVHGYTGFVLSFAKARPLWHTSMMPVLFLVSAMVSGVALMMILALVRMRRAGEKREAIEEAVKGMGRILAWLLVADLALTWSEMAVMSVSEERAREAAGLLLAGPLAPYYLGLETLAGKLTPMVIAFLGGRRIAWLGLAALLALMGILAMRLNIVLGGEYLPLV